MNVVKGLAVGLLCFLLFLCLSIFGICYTVKSTALNPDFVASEINQLDASAFVQDFVNIEPPPEIPELDQIVYESIENVEPVVKERLDATIHAVFEYFPDKTRDLELNSILREHFFTADFVSSIVDNIDISALTGPIIRQQLVEEIHLELVGENIDEFIEDAIEDSINEAEPEIKKQLVAVADPVFDYILMESQTLNASISLEEVKDVLRDNLRESLSKSPPPELEMIPEGMRLLMFDSFYDEIEAQIPSEIILDESVIGPDVPADINEMLNATEDALIEASTYVNYFQTAYILLIVLMVLLVLGVVLIIRDVRIITRRLGVPLISYGAIQYASIWVTKYLIGGKIPFPELMPPYLETWVSQFTNDFLRPLEIFSLALLIIGVVLVVVSYLYKRGEAAD